MPEPTVNPIAFAEIIRRACLETALTTYEDAGVQGLCEAGRWEAAIGAIESLDVRPLIEHAAEPASAPENSLPLPASAPPGERQLVLERLIPIAPEKLYRCWTEPELLKQWFCPKPWGVSRAELDLRPGGICHVTMRSPEGAEFPNPGLYLDVVPNRRLVFTDAYVDAWTPSEKPFMTGIITFIPEGDGTRYTASALHWSSADREAHEKMGFHEGWSIATDQLTALAAML